jgi:hypothetical protein
VNWGIYNAFVPVFLAEKFGWLPDRLLNDAGQYCCPVDPAAGGARSLININSLPMVVDMVNLARVDTYTRLNFLFATLVPSPG